MNHWPQVRVLPLTLPPIIQWNLGHKIGLCPFQVLPSFLKKKKKNSPASSTSWSISLSKSSSLPICHIRTSMAHSSSYPWISSSIGSPLTPCSLSGQDDSTLLLSLSPELCSPMGPSSRSCRLSFSISSLPPPCSLSGLADSSMLLSLPLEPCSPTGPSSSSCFRHCVSTSPGTWIPMSLFSGITLPKAKGTTSSTSSSYLFHWITPFELYSISSDQDSMSCWHKKSLSLCLAVPDLALPLWQNRRRPCPVWIDPWHWENPIQAERSWLASSLQKTVDDPLSIPTWHGIQSSYKVLHFDQPFLEQIPDDNWWTPGTVPHPYGTWALAIPIHPWCEHL